MVSMNSRVYFITIYNHSAVIYGMCPIYVEIDRQKLSINTKQHFFFIFVNYRQVQSTVKINVS